MIRPFLIVSAAAAFFVINDTSVNGDQVQLNIQSGVVLSWPTTNNDIYQPQWSPGSGGSWNALGGSLPGDGTTNSLYDPVPSGVRSY
ncbi:MAG TPA: hypothetical protein VK840_05450, partial [Candidatus Dormibacteraeota bacterium]|nr:hypothetical protein [Candidatus Dormibacteraeota bacterium]